MVRVPGTSKKDPKAKEFQESIAIAETARPTPMKEEYIQSLGRSVYSIISPEVIKLLQDEKLTFLIPMLDHLNRMTSISKVDVEIDVLDIEAMFYKIQILTDERQYNKSQRHLLDSLLFFTRHIPSDSYDGFKAKLMTVAQKLIRTEIEEKKTKGLFG